MEETVVIANMDEPESSKLFKSDCKRKKSMNEVTIMDLPMVEILSRLPIKPIFRCKTVCKLWYHLLTNDPLFLNMYQTRSPNFPCILLYTRGVDGQYNPSLLELKADYDYYSCPLNRPILLSPKFHLPPLKSPVFVVGSCNGFICLLKGLRYEENHYVYINNPLLGEYVKIKLPKRKKSVSSVAYGFCFSEASGQYKVLRAVVRKFGNRAEVSELEVYTLGVDEKWRNVGQAPCSVSNDLGNVNVSGALHWMDHGETISIYSFDIGTEKLKSLPPPSPGLGNQSFCLTLAELGNCLYLIDYIHRGRVDIWWMKEYGIAESWTKDSISVDSFPGVVLYSCQAILIWRNLDAKWHSINFLQPKRKQVRGGQCLWLWNYD